MDQPLINDIAVCIVVAWMMAVGAQLLAQPLILAYLVAGFAVGPVGLGWVSEQASIETISSFGLILLLFIIGLEIDLKKVLATGRIIIVTATAQILVGCLLGLLFFKLLGFPLRADKLDALYLAVAAALSSTIIIVKILYDKRELDTLPGRVTLGILILQDMAAILFLALQPNLNDPAAGALLLSLGKAVMLVAVAFGVSRYALPPVFKAVARLPELVQVGALAWCFLVAGLASYLGLSREMGALVAGVAISTFPYALDVTARVSSLRDFFVTLFFVALGMAVPAPTSQMLMWALVFALFVIVSRMLTVFLPLFGMRQGHRVSLLPAINLSQASEFSLVILTLGLQSGQIDKKTFDLAAYAFVFLAIGSTYAIMNSDGWVRRLSPFLSRAGLRDLDQHTEIRTRPHGKPTIFLLGFSWTASSLLEGLARNAPSLIDRLAVIDFNPQVNAELRKRRVEVLYGDISQRETLNHAGVGQAEIIICSLPNTVLKGSTNLRLLQQLRELNPAAQIIVHAELLSDLPRLYAAGANYVSAPRLLEADELRAVIEAAEIGMLDQKRAEMERLLIGRNEVIP